MLKPINLTIFIVFPFATWLWRGVLKIIARQVSNAAAAGQPLTYAISNCSYIISTADSSVKDNRPG
jgi:hypothetical protein